MKKIRLHYNGGNALSLNEAFREERDSNGNIWKVVEIKESYVKVVSLSTSSGYWNCRIGPAQFSYEIVRDEIILPKELFEI